MLWIIAVMALVARTNPALALIALVWGLIAPILGITQDQLLPGSLHWLVQALHLLVGLGAIALANILARQIAQASATRRAGVLVA